MALASVAGLWGQEPDLAVSKDYGVSKNMRTLLPDDRMFSEFREADFAKINLEDPRLQAAYVRLFTSAIGDNADHWQLEPHIQAAFNDLKVRGNSVTPLLIQLMQENPDTQYEAGVLFNIDQIPGLELGPYLNYVRGVLETRYSDIRPTLAEACATFVLQKGDASDVERLKNVIEKRPYLEHLIKSEMRFQASRVSQESNAPAKLQQNDASSPAEPKVQQSSAANDSDKVVHTLAVASSQTGNRVWVLWLGGAGLMILVFASLFVFRRRK